jgi:hypothetical protein
LFEEVSEDQFIERSLRPNPPRRVTSITSVDMTGDGKTDLLFSTFEENKKKTTVSISRGLDRFSFAPHQTLFSFEDSVGAVRFIQGTFVDNDTSPDIVAVLGGPVPSILLLFSNQTGGIRDSVQWIRDVDIPGEDALTVRDLNNDGFRDLCFVDTRAKSVSIAFGANKGSFQKRKTIVPSGGIVAIMTGPFRSPSENDLVVSNQAEGTVSLISNPF